MNLAEATQVAGALGAVLAGANIIFTWHTRSQTPTANAVKDLECEVDKLDRRTVTMEERIKHLPSKDDVTQVNLAVTRMTGQLSVVEAEMAATGRTLRRLEDHLRGERA